MGPRSLGTVIGVIAVAAVVAMILMWPGSAPDAPALVTGEIREGTVEAIDESPCAAGATEPSAGICVTASIRIDDDRIVVVVLPTDGPLGPLSVGDGLILERPSGAPADAPWGVIDRDRRPALIWLAIVFAVAVVALARLRGALAVAGLLVAIALLAVFTLPAIVAGESPLAVAVVTAAAMAIILLVLAHGPGESTWIAVLGTLGGVSVAAVIGAAWIPLARITGLDDEAAGIVLAAGVQVDLAGLVLAGTIIGALGAIDDVAVTQVSAVRELAASDIGTDPKALRSAGMRVGRDHVGSIVNTLALAYVGASLPLLIVFEISGAPIGRVVSSEIVATDIVRTLVGSLGLLAAVPITTWLAAAAARR
jgi:uncharacterized membrane protein